MAKNMGNKGFYTIPFVWSKKVWVITFAFFAIWLGVSVWLLCELFATANIVAPLTSLILFNAVMLLVMLWCEGYAPQRLEIGADRIVVLRRYKSVTIHLDEIQSVERLPENALRGAIRTGGVGGLFGFYGKFYTRKIGSFSLYATGSENLFLIRKWDGTNIVISCSEPDKIIKFINGK